MVADGRPWSPLAARRPKAASADPVQLATRPKIGVIPVSLHQGAVFRSSSNGEKAKDFVPRWGQLAEAKLCLSSDSTKSLKELIPLDSILSIHVVTDHKMSIEGEDVHCFEVNTGSRARSHVIGCLSPSERGLWMQKLLEIMTDFFPSTLTAQYTIAGWCFLKEGISGLWKSAWVLLEKRNLFFCQDKGKVHDVDLRKARCIVLQNDVDSFKGTSEAGPYIMVDSPERALYLQFDTSRETKTWRQLIKSAAVNNGSSLYDQQLTKDDIPVIVDKCINFVYAHGSMSEGIYRRNGSNSKVSKLLSELRKDAWAVQLSRQEYSEYDVGSALKRFFRDLPEPLLSPTLYKYFCNASSIKCTRDEKIGMYRHALEKLSSINYVTTRRLIGHLYFIHEQSDKNRMPVDNLAALWGPTIMHVEGNGGLSWAKKECEVVCDLIQLYKSVFLVDGEEMAREERIREVLERFHKTPPAALQRPSGDLKIWIYIGSKESGECVNISVGPNCEAGNICKDLSSRTEFSCHELCLTETILGGSLSRPLHHTELVLDTVLRWVHWDPADCKDNYLVLTPNIVFREIIPIAKPPMTKCGELKYADPKSKSFKTYLFEFSQAKLSYYKDKACSIKLNEWKIEDIIWYIGHEPKRNPQSRWAITFVNKDLKMKRSNESPYFGHAIAGTTRDEQLQWMTTMLLGQYLHTDLLPRPNLLE
ncbi:hypothetical protein AAG570_011955 [Ranatra chinensis]|uniref:Uncharacterized protein n=1 Tax=Ranatra chinensis TaxID=642074 RepID=A0ABD0YJG1_9HEMI